MEFEYTVNERDLLTVDMIGMLYAGLPTGGFLTEDGLEVKTVGGAHVDARGNRATIADAWRMLGDGLVEHASLSHSPIYGPLLAGAGYWRVDLNAADGDTVKVSIDADSPGQVRELKAIIDSYLVVIPDVVPRPEPIPFDEDHKSS